jgi:hypothetical protein
MADDSASTPRSPDADTRPRERRRERRPRAPGAYLRLPLWQRFVLASGIAVALLVAMVIYVEHNNTNSNPTLNEAAQVRANREAEILVAQDQAPRTLRLRGRPAQELEHAIYARIAAQIAAGAIAGPVEPGRCRLAGPSAGGSRAVSCTIVSGDVTYPFVGVVDTATRRITYCKRDPPPAPSDNVPVSRRCRL